MFSFLLFFLACNSDGDQPKNNEGRKVFHYNQIIPISSLDPAFARTQNNIWAVDHLYNGLVQLNDALEVKPDLATSWEISDDGLEYRFQLRDDVFFHDDPCFPEGKGRKITAQDVVYSFNRIIDQQINSPGSWIFKGKIRAEQPFEARSEKEFVLHLKKAFRPMLGILTMQYCSVLPKEAVAHYGKEFRSHPVGSGPFKFKKWLENQSLFLVKNEKYFEKEGGAQLPYLDGIRVSFMTDRKTAYLEMLNGKLDFMSGLESSVINELLDKEGALKADKKEKLKFYKSPYLNMEYLGINLEADKSSALQKKKVRQALNYGFDRAKMMKALRNNVGKPANSGFTPRGLPSFDAAKVPGYTFDPDKARGLLAEAGYPNGKGFPEISLMTNKDYLDLCTFITRQWQDLGIDVKIEVVESATLRQRMRTKTAHFFRGSWIADYPDAESFFTMFYSQNPPPPNYTRFKNDQFDKLYEKALLENDDIKRNALYHEMESILIDEAPVIFLFYDETALFSGKNISGVSKNAINLLDVKRIKKQ